MSQKIKDYQDDFQPSQMVSEELNHLHDHFSEPVHYFHLPDANIEPQQAIFYDCHQSIPQKQNLQQQQQSITLMTMQEVSQFLQIGKKQYLHESRQVKLERYRQKKSQRKWGKKISYTCRQSVAKQRLRVKGRFISKGQAQGIEKYFKESLEMDKINSTFSIQSPRSPTIKVEEKDSIFKETQYS